jgi:uncharacterized protein (DUF305 family)
VQVICLRLTATENNMSFRYQQAAAASAALLAAITIAACGTSAAPAAPATSTATAPASAAGPLVAFNTADVTFTTSALGLEEQAAALAVTVTGHTATPELRQFAARVHAQAGDVQDMRALMGDWHRGLPAPYSPGASLPAGMMGAGMMSAGNWAEMSRQYGRSFDSAWLHAMISGYDAEVALCQQELSSGLSSQARALARTMLAQRQSELAQLQQWQHDGQQMGMTG